MKRLTEILLGLDPSGHVRADPRHSIGSASLVQPRHAPRLEPTRRSVFAITTIDMLIRLASREAAVNRGHHALAILGVNLGTELVEGVGSFRWETVQIVEPHG
jgi:hypothetical protein